MYQRIEIIGNLGTDPEQRETASGTVTSFSVAVNRRYKGEDTTVWFRVSAWNKLAEIAYQYLSKGRQVFVAGVLTADYATGAPRIYTRKDGQPAANFEIMANEIQFLGSAAERRETKVSDTLPF